MVIFHHRMQWLAYRSPAQAELAARDLMRLSRPGSRGATGTSATPEGSGFAWSFLSHLSAMVLNRLQMTISNVHICFQVSRS